ncbi:hypothetical protein HN873_048159 [Arachis hypogaea]
MSDPQRKGKGKATTGKRKRGEFSMTILDILHDDSWREKNFTPQEKADQLLTATNQVKFANRYCELKYPVFATSRNLSMLPGSENFTVTISRPPWMQCTSEGNRFWSLRKLLRTSSTFSLSPISLTATKRLKRI